MGMNEPERFVKRVKISAAVIHECRGDIYKYIIYGNMEK